MTDRTSRPPGLVEGADFYGPTVHLPHGTTYRHCTFHGTPHRSRVQVLERRLLVLTVTLAVIGVTGLAVAVRLSPWGRRA